MLLTILKPQLENFQIHPDIINLMKHPEENKMHVLWEDLINSGHIDHKGINDKGVKAIRVYLHFDTFRRTKLLNLIIKKLTNLKKNDFIKFSSLYL